MHSSDPIKQQIEDDISTHPVILYMKGTAAAPQCGFSARVVEILDALGIAYETRNVLESEQLRHGIKEYSDWPTIPQLYIHGEFIGGADIVSELYESGKLQKKIAI